MKKVGKLVSVFFANEVLVCQGFVVYFKNIHKKSIMKESICLKEVLNNIKIVLWWIISYDI